MNEEKEQAATRLSALFLLVLIVVGVIAAMYEWKIVTFTILGILVSLLVIILVIIVSKEIKILTEKDQ